MSDDSDVSSKRNRKKRKPVPIGDSSSDSSVEIVASRKKRRKHKNYIRESDSDSDSSVNIIYRKTRVFRVTSDSDSSTSDDGTNKSNASSSDSEYESDWISETEAAESKPPDPKPQINENEAANSDSSNGESEKCPICLQPFKSQEVGSPESCDHSFCVDCIVEWSKNVNTCPVDRQPFNLILVRKNYDGKVIKQIPVEPATQQNEVDEIVEDPTFCEICGRSDAEDRMLLCDGCDLGFHLECLDPPLQEVPAGVWYCRDCGPELISDDPMIDVYEVHLLLEDAETLGWPTRARRRNHATPRLVPRTRQSERVRARIITRRSRRLDEQQDEAPRGEGVSNQPGPSSSIARDVSSTRNNGTKKRKYKKRKRKPRIKVTYEIDEKTGQKIAIETKIKRKYRRKKRKSRAQRDRARRPAQPKTVKKRLAVQLGMCPPRQVGQTLPDVRIPNNPNTINFQRSQAGIPTLHLFGRRNELDYFSQSDSDGDVNEGVNVLIRRRPHPSEAALLRRAVRRKAVISGPTSSPPNILDSILDSQSKLHSKNSVMSLNKDGTVKIDKNDTANNNRRLENNRNLNVDSRDLSSDRSRVNLNSFNSSFRQTPMYGNGDRNNTNPMYMSPNNYNRTLSSENLDAVTTSSGGAASHNQGPDEDESEQSYSVQPACSSYDSESDSKKDKDKEKSRSGTPGTHSDSELDIYSDIETVSTSRAEESDIRPSTPPQAATPNTLTDEDGNNSDVDLVIDTEKVDDKFDDSKELVTSTVDLAIPVPTLESNSSQAPHSTSDIQNEMVHSSDNKMGVGKEVDKDDDEDSEDGCPNFSIYSTESINLAKTTDLQLLSDSPMVPMNDDNEVGSSKTTDQPVVQNVPDCVEVKDKKEKNHGGLYSDDEDETLIKIDHKVCEMETATNEDKSNEKPFGIGDISNMTEDISEEERSYTPCLDERALSQKQGLEGLDTELISDEERNDFDESHELKTASDGDALEINAKESELDFSKPEDYEEGEIVDKLKAKKAEEIKKATEKEEEKPDDKKENKENENLSFKKLSKNSKERNYRDKDKEKERDRSKSKEKKERDRDKENRKERKKEKRKEIERYNVRSIIAEKPRRMKDKFGRDEQRKRSVSRSKSSRSPSFTRRSCSRERRTVSRERVKFRGRSRTRRSLSRSKSPEKRRSRSKIKKHRSLSRDKAKPRRKSGTVAKHKRKDSRSRHKSMSPRRRRDWVGRRQSRGWSRSTHSYTPEQRLTPSWTPPRIMQPQPVVKPHNLTVILNNDINKKKKEKKKKLEKRKEIEKAKKRRREKTPPPSKEVFASGNNILVSVSFNKDTNERDVTKRKRTATDEITTKRTRKEKEKRKSDERRKKKNKDLAGIKPVAIIDLERSPFREITPSPDDIIVLSDSENCESNDMMGLQKVMCDSSQQVASPERSVNTSYLTGPKTPPEPQVKFILNAQQPKIRAISNPLHEPDDVEVEIDPQEELEQRLNDTLHKGPNTPPEPPISPPSSPDAYDPFDPTKSRSPTPQPLSQTVQSSTSQNDVTRDDVMDSRNDDDEIVNTKSHTPPVIADIQPADSQSNIKATSPEKSPEHTISVIINQVVQSQASIFPTVTSKPSYSTNALITSTPINLTAPRINILNSTILTPPNVASAVPQRIVLPNTTKSSPVKVSPNKLPIKSTPIKPMPAKNIVKSKPSRKSNEKEIIDVTLDFDSPYSPGSNDYEDLFEPPSDNIKISSKPSSKNTKSPTKGQSTFDVLFGSSPVNNLFKNKGKAKPTKYKKNSKGTKQVGVKIDEDTLKILDELPNSAVEMQVKDKYLKKLNRQERVVEEVKLVLKPHYNKKHINKEEYKDILRRSVPKICHNKSGEINPKKIQNLIEAYVKKVRHSKKVTSSSSVNPQKV